MEEYTKLSQEAFNKLLQNDLSPSEAIAYFKNHIPTRTFKEVLSAVYANADIESRLIDGLIAFRNAFHEVYQSVYPTVRRPTRDGISGNVSNWINGITLPQKRLDGFGICFALGLGINEADILLRKAFGYGFHMREPLEIALFYCLNSKKSMEESAAFIKGLDFSVPDVDLDAKETDIVKKEFCEKVYDDKSMIAFLDENRSSFGKMHNTAFKKFSNYYAVLSTPDNTEKNIDKNGTGPSVENIPIGVVVAERLRFGVPLTNKLKGYSEYQKKIKEDWLGETIVKNMLNRKVDISRKAILLSYIATSGYGQSTYTTKTVNEENVDYDIEPADTVDIDDLSYEDTEWDAIDDLTPQQSLFEHKTRLEVILTKCGFARLDPRTPFDWLILYSLCVNEMDYYDDAQKHEFGLMSERLEAVLKLLFAEMSGNDLHDDLS